LIEKYQVFAEIAGNQLYRYFLRQLIAFRVLIFKKYRFEPVNHDKRNRSGSRFSGNSQTL